MISMILIPICQKQQIEYYTYRQANIIIDIKAQPFQLSSILLITHSFLPVSFLLFYFFTTTSN